MQQVITARFINQPKNPTGKFGNIKDADKNTYFMPKGMLAMVQPGVPFTADIEEQNWQNGPVQVITKILAQSSPATQARAANGHAPNDTERQIFITGVVGRAMGSGQFGVNDIKVLTLAADAAWQALQASKRGNISASPENRQPPAQQAPNYGDELNDSIPF